MGRHKHIIWDWNGTLVDDVWLCVEILNEIMARYGKGAITQEQYLEEFDFPVKDYYSRLGFDFPVESFEKIAREYIEIYNKRQFECKLHDGVEDVLSFFKQGYITQSILSAYHQQMLEEIVEHFGLTDYFAFLAGLDDYYADSKVHKGRKLIEQLDTDADKVLLIGDTVHDYEVANEIGVDCVLVANGHQNKDRLKSCGCEVLESLEQVILAARRYISG